MSQTTSKRNVGNDGVAVIGFGTAGFNAVVALRCAGYQGTIRVFSNTDMLPYSPILTSYYAGGEKQREQCFPWSQEEVDELGAQVMLNSPVIDLDTQEHVIRTDAGSFCYDKCVIATGATPQSFGFPQDCGYQPYMLRTMNDADRFKQAITDPGCRKMLVSGASMVALKMLEACLNRGVQMTLVGMNPHILDFNALPEAAVRYEAGLHAQGVELRLGQTIKQVCVVPNQQHPLGRVLQVTFSTGDVDEFDQIAVAHGMKCNLDFVREGSLEIDRGLLVDQFMRTSDPDVYAAGDIVQSDELVSGQKRIVGIWKNAARQGAVAGAAIAAEMAGQQPDPSNAYQGSIAMNTIAVRGTLFISAGAMEPFDGGCIEVDQLQDMTIVRVYAGENDAKRLVGFNLVCDKDQPGGPAYDMGAMLTMRIEQGCS